MGPIVICWITYAVTIDMTHNLWLMCMNHLIDLESDARFLRWPTGNNFVSAMILIFPRSRIKPWLRPWQSKNDESLVRREHLLRNVPDSAGLSHSNFRPAKQNFPIFLSEKVEKKIETIFRVFYIGVDWFIWLHFCHFITNFPDFIQPMGSFLLMISYPTILRFQFCNHSSRIRIFWYYSNVSFPDHLKLWVLPSSL